MVRTGLVRNKPELRGCEGEFQGGRGIGGGVEDVAEIDVEL
jgi:hypothetical protein